MPTNFGYLEFLQGVEGTEVTLDSSTEPPFYFPRQTWVIVEKLEEWQSRSTKDETESLGDSLVAGKFLCHRVEDPSKLAFMRIYVQIPYIGSELIKAEERAKQAAPPFEFIELTALKTFKLQNCTAIPDLLGYQHGVQDSDGLVPGGYITHLVWDKVPGEPLRKEIFWQMDFSRREEFRARFREIYL